MCRCVYKGRDNKLFLYAATEIKKGERLSHSRVRNVCHTATEERRNVLRQAGILCQCERCLDPTENGTFIRLLQSVSFTVISSCSLSSALSGVRSVMDWSYLSMLWTLEDPGDVQNAALRVHLISLSP